MKTFIVCAHTEPRSFNGALFQTAQDALRAIKSEKPIDVGEY
jgi:putative NADPH-quinone reductase